MFYNIDYRIYKSNVKVESLTKSSTADYANELKATNNQLTTFMSQTPVEVKALIRYR